MKKIGAIAMVSAFILLLNVSTALAFRCPALINEVNALISAAGTANASGDAAVKTKIADAQKLIGEAQSMHGGGNHKASLDKVADALKAAAEARAMAK
ncbi:MAG: hypothetical protein HY731_08605 [Candidatus Tectomicrobia bacterium]|nr:hypothetical protein [Candidatus Tectomicrobia bacterium]